MIKNGDLTLRPVDRSLLALHTTYWPITLGTSAEQNDYLHTIQDYHGDPRYNTNLGPDKEAGLWQPRQTGAVYWSGPAVIGGS